MRIIAGKHKGRVLRSFSGRRIRPTSDRLRESLFNILQGEFEDATVWDAFAGTGALGLESISRGAASVVFTEDDPQALALLQENVKLLQASHACRIVPTDAISFAEGSQDSFDLIFLDPPYNFQRYLELAHAIGLHQTCRPAGRIILEHHRKSAPVEQLLALIPATRQVRQGDSALSFFPGGEFTRRAHELKKEGAWQ